MIGATEGGVLSVYVNRVSTSHHFTSLSREWSAGQGFDGAWEYGTVRVALWENYVFAFEAKNGDNTLFVLGELVLFQARSLIIARSLG